MNSREQHLTQALLRRHRHAGVLIDTNLLILFFVGVFDARYISRFSRTSAYDEGDFVLLAQVLQAFRRVIVTPHILTEVSNPSGAIGDQRYEYFQTITSLLNDPSGLLAIVERHRPARLLSTEPPFPLLGLADTGIIDHAVHRHCLVLTDDAPLAEHLSRVGVDCLTLNDLRPYAAGTR